MKNIQTYYQFVNEDIDYDIIDPYGEEVWNDDKIFDFSVGDEVITNGTIFYGLSPNGKVELKDRIGKIVRIKDRSRGGIVGMTSENLMIVVKFEGEKYLLGTVLSPYKDCWPFFVKNYQTNRTDGYFECTNHLFIKKL